jgi:hypothetical protein
MKTFFKFLSLFAFLLVLSLSGCKDECDDVNCQNGATCDDGNCACTTGFEGNECQAEQRAKFLGLYNVAETCTENGAFSFTMTVVGSSTGIRNIILDNFYGIGVAVTANVTSSNAITIPNQTVNAQGNAYTFSGSGQITGNILTLSYNVSIGGAGETCTANATKQ